jgi:3-oxoadipate enol-lactonase
VTTVVTGSGDPVTVVAHGLGATIAETRALVGGVAGTKVFPEARAHGSAPLPVEHGYQELADDLLAVADAHAATAAFGVSMGAHAILRILGRQPTRFQRVVLFLPATIDTPVRRTPALASALASGDRDRLLSAVQGELGWEGPAAEAYAAARTDFMLACPGLPGLLSTLADDSPVPDRTVLSSVTADVLVIGQEGDELHPASVARELAAALPRARLLVFDRPGAALAERQRFRTAVAEHLNRVLGDLAGS